MSTQQPFSPWNYKPWWCQPWSILLTGTLMIAGSWFLVRLVWVTVLIAIPILAWWAYFLVLWPELVRRSSSWEIARQDNEDSIS
ncbi:MAG TPA: DUF6737 family protein [Coleofasciculaceae cyanobacterium]